MKRLRETDVYPSELWDRTSAPTWSADRVWQQIESAEPMRTQPTWWWLWLFLLALGVGSLRWIGEEVKLAKEQPSLLPASYELVGEEELITPVDTNDETGVAGPAQHAPTIIPADAKPVVVPQGQKAEDESLPVDTLQLVNPIPVADFELPDEVPLLPINPGMAVPRTDVATTLPTVVRPGSKLMLKIPEIPAAEVRQGAFAKRLWQQYKRLNTEGEIDWLELGIQPNGDGTFSILPPANKTTTKPN